MFILVLLDLLPDEELVRISLDELGVYFVAKQSNTYRVLYQRYDNTKISILGDGMSFNDVVSVVLSTSPGMQPYPAGVTTVPSQYCIKIPISNT